MRFKAIFPAILVFHILSIFYLQAQQAKLIHKGDNQDPSYYDITKINNNEFWAGGEYGVLNAIDSLGIISAIKIPFECSHILRIKKFKSKVYIVTANGQLVVYNLETKTFSLNDFNGKFNKNCFYDLLIIEDGTLYICGGASRIASGRISYPNGFVLKTSVKNTTDHEIIWKNKNSFVWSMLYDQENKSLLISAFSIPFMKSTIYSSKDNGAKWLEEYKIKGIVYNIDKIGDELWYSGSKSIFYNKHGILGQLNTNSDRIIVEDIGCIYNLFFYNDKMISCNYRGKFYEFDAVSKSFEDLENVNSYPLYASVLVSPGKLFIVGHGNTIYLYNYTKEDKTQVRSNLP